MNTSVVNIKVDPDVKREAQKVAHDLGISLSGVINGFLKHLVRTKTIHFSLNEEPSDYLVHALKESRKDIKMGRVISFDDPDRALAFLDKMIADEKKHQKN